MSVCPSVCPSDILQGEVNFDATFKNEGGEIDKNGSQIWNLRPQIIKKSGLQYFIHPKQGL